MAAKQRKRGLGRALELAAALLILCLSAQAASKYKILHSFNGSDGSGPYGGVTLQDGNLYGTTVGGGPDGNVFELEPQKYGPWQETVLYGFLTCSDGCNPESSVAFDAAGNLYGTTVDGGAYQGGTVFELTPGSGGWTESLVHSFCAWPNCSDGWGPRARVLIDAAGNLYGTGGVAFELSPGPSGWKETMLHDFTGQHGDGSGPYAGLIMDQSGNLYGTTSYGGNKCGTGSPGCGTVYELSPEPDGGWKETILHRFADNGEDGVFPGRRGPAHGPLGRPLRHHRGWRQGHVGHGVQANPRCGRPVAGEHPARLRGRPGRGLSSRRRGHG